MNFDYPLHNTIVQVLSCLNAELLASAQAYFGGGTLIALSYGEHRLSRDIDFLCPFGAGYSQLRRAVFAQGYDALFARRDTLRLPDEI